MVKPVASMLASEISHMPRDRRHHRSQRPRREAQHCDVRRPLRLWQPAAINGAWRRRPQPHRVHDHARPRHPRGTKRRWRWSAGAKSRICEIIEQHLAPIIGLESPDEIEHLQATWASLLSPKPLPHPLAVWNVYHLDVAHDRNVNFIGPFEIWDPSILRSIDDSQYIDELYGGAAEARNPTVNIAM